MFNEGSQIRKNIQSSLEVLKDLGESWELIIVDDGSTDDSKKQAEETMALTSHAQVLSYFPNRGRGFALRKGFQAAKGDFVIATESDLSWGADCIKRILSELKSSKADVVIVSPFLNGGGFRNVPLQRRLLSAVGNKILTFGLPGGLTMVTGMTRGYRRELLDRVLLQMDDKEIHLEILSKLIALGARIREIPGTITWSRHDKKKSSRKGRSKTRQWIVSHLYFSFAEAPLHFLGMLSLFFLLLSGAGIVTIIVLKFLGFSLLRIPYFPHYVMISLLIGIMIFIFSLISSQIKNLQGELLRIYAEIARLNTEKKDKIS